MIKRGLWLCLVALGAGCAGLNPPAASDPAAHATLVHTPAPASNLTRTAAAQPTRKDFFRVHLLLPEGGRLVTGDNPVQVRVFDRWGDTVGGASVKLQFWLPTLAMDGPPCRVRETDAGLYQVSGVNLPQTGDWMLTVTVNRSGREDWAVYELPVGEPAPAKIAAPKPALSAPAPARTPNPAESRRQPAAAAAKPSPSAPAQPTAKLNLSRSRASAKGTYKVAYLPKPANAKPNQALTWRVTLHTKSGRPVTGAKLRLSLSRPPDGPERAVARLAAKDQGQGYYQVEGLRIPDKGWWRVSLDISGKRGNDRVEFNLVLE